MGADRDSGTDGELTIGELARLARVSPRAIRYYHSVGLLAEPPRDASGYRRYGPADVVSAVRVARLRAHGMPVEQIRETVAISTDGADLRPALAALADDLKQEMGRLADLHTQLLRLAEAPNPADALATALRERSLLSDEQELSQREKQAADVIDALHPDGIRGALRQAEGLFADPRALGRLQALLGRFRALPESGEDPDTLAAELANAIPRPADAATPVDVSTMDKLVGGRLHPRQRRCLHEMRSLIDRRDNAISPGLVPPSSP